MLETGIFGMDLICALNLKLDYSQMNIRTSEENFSLRSKNGKRLVTCCWLEESYTIPPWTERIVFLDKQHETEDLEGMIEPIQNPFHTNQPILISRCLVREDLLYSRIANVSENQVTLDKQQVICRFISSSVLHIEDKKRPHL